jgi:hypothetical protein
VRGKGRSTAGAVAEIAGCATLLWAAVLGACQKSDYHVATVGPAGVEVVADGLVVAQTTIGSGRHSHEATYVLVDVRNRLSADLFVELHGELVDGDGQAIGTLYPDSLRIPGRGLRTFALVHHEGVVPAARSAKLRLGSVRLAVHDAAIEITDGHVYQDGDRVVVAGYARNLVDRPAHAIIIAGFYDAAGRLLQRPHTVVPIQPGDKHPAQFVGPAGSASAYLFVGDASY